MEIIKLSLIWAGFSAGAGLLIISAFLSALPLAGGLLLMWCAARLADGRD